MDKIELIATSVFGIESIVGRELKWLGYDNQRVENGRVTFEADLRAICRSNIWLRTAERILIKVGSFKAETFEELFQGTKSLPWEQWLPEDAIFPVEGKSVKSKLFSVSDCQAIVKKAIVEKLKTKYKREIFEETGAKYKIEVSLLNDIATLSIDTSGAGLHKRGYRKLVSAAPLKETLTSALLLISRWKKDRVLIDPFCGSGTIPIEAALIALNIPPGLNREFISQEWPNIPERYWTEAFEEARGLIEPDREVRIQGSDISGESISLARYHAKLAGVDKHIHLQQMDFKAVSSRYDYGFIICNPPYGERLGEEKEIERLYKDMGKAFKSFETWSYYILTSYKTFERLFGRKADKKRKLYNGMIECDYYQFFGPPPPRKDNITLE